MVVWLLCDEKPFDADSLDLYTSSPPRSLLKVAQTYASKASRGIVLLCLDATLKGGGLEAARQMLHSHGWKLARDIGSDRQIGAAAFRSRTQVERPIQYAVKQTAEQAGGGCAVQLSDW